eukprot:3266938-Rhodomonas_salina.1
MHVLPCPGGPSRRSTSGLLRPCGFANRVQSARFTISIAMPWPIKAYWISCIRSIGGVFARCSSSSSLCGAMLSARASQYLMVGFSASLSMLALASAAGSAPLLSSTRTISVPSRSSFETASVSAVVLSPMMWFTFALRWMRSRATRSWFWATAYANGVRPSLTCWKEGRLIRSGRVVDPCRSRSASLDRSAFSRTAFRKRSC